MENMLTAESLVNGTISLPPTDPLANDNRYMAYFVMADDAFKLRTNLIMFYSWRKMTKEEGLKL